MKTSIIGYPRIGSQRELKFASEKYFKGVISSEELRETAKKLRFENLELQRKSGLDIISSNDFSFYDGMLDTAVLLNALPKRYAELGLSEIDTYFAAARGYQGEKGDVKALAMKKWFNTNYHYMVSEIDDTEIKLVGSKPFELLSEALQNGVKTKPVIIGAYTFLKLSRFTGTRKAEDFAEETAAAYIEILRKFSGENAEWIQLDELAGCDPGAVVEALFRAFGRRKLRVIVDGLARVRFRLAAGTRRQKKCSRNDNVNNPLMCHNDPFL